MGSLHVVNHASKSIVTVAACAALAISAAGCGEKEEPGTTGPVVTQSTTTTTPGQSGSARSSVDDFLSSSDAQKVCDEEITPLFLRKTYGSRGSCLRSRKPASLTKKSYKLTVRPGKGQTTIVTANPQDGRYAGKTLQIGVLRLGSDFRVASLRSNAPAGP